MSRFALVSLIVAAFAADAGANGRPAGTSTINFEQTHETNILAGMTFGTVESKDGGATWQWMCEKAVGYGGMYDPDYAYSRSGTVFATTFNGLTERSDGCTFAATPAGTTFVSSDELGPDGAFYYCAADPADSKIYKSTDDGATFPVSAMPGINNDWWESIKIAPSDASRVYLTGYRLISGQPKKFLLFKSIDGGVSYQPMVDFTTALNSSNNSVIDIVGISSTLPDTMFLKVNLENGNLGDGVWRTTDGGTTWTKIYDQTDPFGLAFLVRSDGSCVAATQTLGAVKSTDCSTATTPTWTPLVNPPHAGCLVENSAHEVWACTQNFGSPGLMSDGFGIMKTTDLATWTGVLKYQDIQAPVSCAAGTAQQDQCVGSYQAMPSVWCCLEQQLGITSTTIDCTQPPLMCGSLAADGAPDAGQVPKLSSTGCCDTGDGAGPVVILMSLAFGGLVLRPRRRR